LDNLNYSPSPQASAVHFALNASQETLEKSRKIEWRELPTPTKNLILSLVPWSQPDRNLSHDWQYYTILEKNQITAVIRNLKNAARSLKGFEI
tara:strand:+ start:921 stop:1199 length:279 start_codon:yes stop_codon:yes gene_type:complete